jgi:hypothetical protein
MTTTQSLSTEIVFITAASFSMHARMESRARALEDHAGRLRISSNWHMQNRIMHEAATAILCPRMDSRTTERRFPRSIYPPSHGDKIAAAPALVRAYIDAGSNVCG